MTFDILGGRVVSIPQGQWHHVETIDGRPSAYLVCPKCGVYISLFVHQIAADGTVHPSVGHATCGYHEFIRLDGWAEVEKEEKTERLRQSMDECMGDDA